MYKRKYYISDCQLNIGFTSIRNILNMVSFTRLIPLKIDNMEINNLEEKAKNIINYPELNVNSYSYNIRHQKRQQPPSAIININYYISPLCESFRPLHTF